VDFDKILDLLDTLYMELQNAKSTDERKERYNKIQGIVNNNPKTHSYYTLYPSARKFKDRVKKKKAKIASLEVFNDGISYDTPTDGGLYFLGETHFNPMTNEKFYWVKIGKAINLRNRLHQYNTCNPMLWRIDFLLHAEDREKHYHSELEKIAIAKCNHNQEWFMVDEKTYLELCNKGFNYFR
jgi:hypothetical protein